MHRSGPAALLVLMTGLRFTPALRAQSITDGVLAFSTANRTPLNQGFASLSTELLGTGVEYADTDLQRIATTLSPGWLLFPPRTTDDAFNWATGLTDSNWVNEIGAKAGRKHIASNLAAVTYEARIGKAGAWFTKLAGWL